MTASKSVSTSPWNGFDAWARRLMCDWDVPGLCLAVLHRDEVVLCKGYGFRNVKKRLPVDPDTIFPICSLTKAFTSALLGMLVDEGRLEWDRPLRAYLPDFQLKDPVATERMTPRDLLCHRCGLPRHEMFWYSDLWHRRELYQRLRYLDPFADFRAVYQYNNLMYMVAGLLIEELAGKTWEEFVTERLFTPLGMTGTTVDIAAARRDPNLVVPYMLYRGSLRAVPIVSIDSIGPAGSINSSLRDMLAWARLHLAHGRHDGRELISRACLEETYRPQTVAPIPNPTTEIPYSTYALGWSVAPYRGVRRLAHSGGIDGISTRMGMLPDHDLAVLVFTNQGGSPLPIILELGIYDRFLGLSPIDWSARQKANRQSAEAKGAQARRRWASERKKGTRPSHPLADYAGDYEHPGYGKISFGVEKGRLVCTFGQFSAPMSHYHYDTFKWEIRLWDTEFWYADWRMTFGADVSGEIASVSVPFEPMTPPIVFTRPTGRRGPVFSTRDGLPFAR
ncbi:serine hydrolase [bacterium]|nr:serine hydrolase [bacterium]